MNINEFKETLISFCKENEIQLSSVWVSHGGALVLMGLREDTNDIDLNVNHFVWNKLVKTGRYPIKQLPNDVFMISVSDKIDVHIGGKIYGHLENTTEGIQYTGINDTLEDYRILNREKDQEIISVLESNLIIAA